MKRPFVFVSLVATLALATLGLAACSQAAAPAPTQAPAKPAAAAPTTAPAAPAAAAPTTAPAASAQPLAAPATGAKPADYPTRPLTMIIPWGPGGSSDLAGRIVGTYLPKVIGQPVNLVNKPGATTEVGQEAMLQAPPDGYTFSQNSLPALPSVYLNPDLHAPFSRKDFAPIAVMFSDPMVVSVKADSPIKDAKDLIDAARAKPGEFRLGDSGVMSAGDWIDLLLASQTNVKFAAVHFSADGESITSMLGGHVDAVVTGLSGAVPQLKAKTIRIVGIADTVENKYAPGAKTFQEQGIDGVDFLISRGFAMSSKVDPAIVNYLAASMKKLTTDPEFIQKADGSGMAIRYMAGADYVKHWDDIDAKITKLMPIAKAQAAKQ